MQKTFKDDEVGKVLADVQLPLENVEYTIEQFLLDRGTRLDLETRCLLATVRDCVGRIAGSTRQVVDQRKEQMLVAG
jgi:hypothetical protein